MIVMTVTPDARAGETSGVLLWILEDALGRHGEVQRVNVQEPDEHGTSIAVAVDDDKVLRQVSSTLKLWVQGMTLENGHPVIVDVYDAEGYLEATVAASFEARQFIKHGDRKVRPGRFSGIEVA